MYQETNTIALNTQTEHNPINPYPENFTEPEAARWLKVSRITLQRARLRGEIAYARIGGCRVIYTRQHLLDYISSRERAAFNPIRNKQASIKSA